LSLVIVFVAAYLIGSVPTGYIVVKIAVGCAHQRTYKILVQW